MIFKHSALPWLLAFALPFSVHADTIHMKDVGFATPEAMEYDADSDTYLVANINGSPFEKDDNGFISKLSPDGKVMELKWLDGTRDDIALNAPKGMVARDGKLYVADIDRLRVFDLKTKKQLDDIVFPGSGFINGVSTAPDGGLYVTDSGMAPGFKPSDTEALYKVDTRGKITQLKSGKLGHPNGVYAQGDTLWMVTLGSGQLRTMTLDGTEKSRMTLPFNRLDGLIVTNDNRLITSSWKAKGVYEITPDDHLKLIVGELESPADLGYDSQRNRLLIPLFLKDEAVIYSLTP
ncbi:MAG: SMP-30/gluconolactonase/LRE family protein [Hydrogenovibrio sp.]